MATVLVTEADSGIGADLAVGLAQANHSVAAASRDGSFPHQAAAGSGIVPIQVDLGDAWSVQAAIAEAADLFSGIDVLIANGAVGSFGPLELVPPPQLDEVLGINLVGQLRVLQAAIPHLRTSSRGQIIGISSTIGMVGLPGGVVPCAARAGFEVAMQALRHELDPFGVRVSIVRAAPQNAAEYGLPFVAEGMEGAAEYRSLIQTVNDFGCQTAPAEAVLQLVVDALSADDPPFLYSLDSYANEVLDELRKASDEETTKTMRELFSSDTANEPTTGRQTP